MLKKTAYTVLFLFATVSHLLIYDIPYFERVRLRSRGKINVGWYPSSCNVVLNARPGQLFTEEDVKAYADEFQAKYGGRLTYINKWGPNFGIESISEDAAYKIASDDRVRAVLVPYSH